MSRSLMGNRIGAIVAAGIGCGAALAQVSSPSPVAGVMSNRSDLTETQRATAVAIETFCPFLPPPNPAGTATERLSNSCTQMVRNSKDSVIPTALQAIASEEMHATGRVATAATGGNAVAGRLLALRGSGRGLLLSDSTITIDGRRHAARDLLPAGSRGGGAAADPGLGSRLGGFVNANYNRGDRDRTDREDGFDFRDAGLTAGVDYRFSDAFVGGVALSWSDTRIDFSDNLGDIGSKALGIVAYGSHAAGPWYVDGQLGYARMDYDTRRNIVVAAPIGFNTAATGSTDGSQLTASIGTGYAFSTGSTTVTPYGRLGYMRLRVDGFTESEPVSGLGLAVGAQTTHSLQSALGARVTKALSTSFGVLTPYASLEWNHEFRNDSKPLVARYAADPFNTFFAIPTEHPDRNFFTLGLGVVTVYANGLSAFLNIDTVLGLAKTKSHALTIGIRGEF